VLIQFFSCTSYAGGLAATGECIEGRALYVDSGGVRWERNATTQQSTTQRIRHNGWHAWGRRHHQKWRQSRNEM